MLPHINSRLNELSTEINETRGANDEIKILVANILNTKAFNEILSEEEGFIADIPLNERLKMFNESIPKGTVGFLCMFKETRKVDRLGRHGDGIPIWSRFAIYRGKNKNEKGEIMLHFDVYKGEDFYTKVHKRVEFEADEEDVQTLYYNKLTINFNQLGILDKYTGTDYHFNYPIQYDEDKSMYLRVNKQVQGTIYSEWGKIRLPNVAKYVFDDYGVKYNEKMLDYAMKETARVLYEKLINKK